MITPQVNEELVKGSMNYGLDVFDADSARVNKI